MTTMELSANGGLNAMTAGPNIPPQTTQTKGQASISTGPDLFALRVPRNPDSHRDDKFGPPLEPCQERLFFAAKLPEYKGLIHDAAAKLAAVPDLQARIAADPWSDELVERLKTCTQGEFTGHERALIAALAEGIDTRSNRDARDFSEQNFYAPSTLNSTATALANLLRFMQKSAAELRGAGTDVGSLYRSLCSAGFGGLTEGQIRDLPGCTRRWVRLAALRLADKMMKLSPLIDQLENKSAGEGVRLPFTPQDPYRVYARLPAVVLVVSSADFNELMGRDRNDRRNPIEGCLVKNWQGADPELAGHLIVIPGKDESCLLSDSLQTTLDHEWHHAIFRTLFQVVDRQTTSAMRAHYQGVKDEGQLLQLVEDHRRGNAQLARDEIIAYACEPQRPAFIETPFTALCDDWRIILDQSGVFVDSLSLDNACKSRLFKKVYEHYQGYLHDVSVYRWTAHRLFESAAQANSEMTEERALALLFLVSFDQVEALAPFVARGSSIESEYQRGIRELSDRFSNRSIKDDSAYGNLLQSEDFRHILRCFPPMPIEAIDWWHSVLQKSLNYKNNFSYFDEISEVLRAVLGRFNAQDNDLRNAFAALREQHLALYRDENKGGVFKLASIALADAFEYQLNYALADFEEFAPKAVRIERARRSDELTAITKLQEVARLLRDEDRKGWRFYFPDDLLAAVDSLDSNTVSTMRFIVRICPLRFLIWNVFDKTRNLYQDACEAGNTQIANLHRELILFASEVGGRAREFKGDAQPSDNRDAELSHQLYKDAEAFRSKLALMETILSDPSLIDKLTLFMDRIEMGIPDNGVSDHPTPFYPPNHQ